MNKLIVPLVLSLFLIVAPSFAQTAAQQDSHSATETQATKTHFKIADRKFWTLAALQAGATVADFETTQWAKRAAPSGAELNPLFGSHPGRPRMYSIGISLTTLQIFLQHRSKGLGKRTGKMKKAWIVGALVNTGLHTFLAVHNAEIASQGFCTQSTPNCR